MVRLPESEKENWKYVSDKTRQLIMDVIQSNMKYVRNVVFFTCKRRERVANNRFRCL